MPLRESSPAPDIPWPPSTSGSGMARRSCPLPAGCSGGLRQACHGERGFAALPGSWTGSLLCCRPRLSCACRHLKAHPAGILLHLVGRRPPECRPLGGTRCGAGLGAGWDLAVRRKPACPAATCCPLPLGSGSAYRIEDANEDTIGVLVRLITEKKGGLRGSCCRAVPSVGHWRGGAEHIGLAAWLSSGFPKGGVVASGTGG